MKDLLGFIFLIVAFVPLCGAWENEPGVFPLSLVADIQKDLVLSGVGVVISKDATHLRYTFVNKGKDNISRSFALYNPVFSWAGVGAEYPDRHFPEISMTANGRLINREDHFSALYDGADVTHLLKESGLSPSLPGYGDEAIINLQSSKKIKNIEKLIKRNVVIKIGGAGLPNWKLLAAYTWRADFASKKQVELVWTFKTRPAFRLLNRLSAEDKGVLYSNCAPSDFVDGLSEKMAEGYLLKEYRVSFDIEKQNLSNVNVDISGVVNSMAGEKHIFYCGMPYEKLSGNVDNGKVVVLKAKGGVFSFVTLEKL